MSIVAGRGLVRPAVAPSVRQPPASKRATALCRSVDKAADRRANRRRSVAAACASSDAVDGAESRSASRSAATSRRGALGGALASALVAATARPSRADDDVATPDASSAPESEAEAPPAPTPTPAPTAVPPVRYKGSSPGNWSVVVPGEYRRMSTEKPRRIYEQRTDCEPNCRDLQAKRTEETPLVARFGSADEREDVSVSVRGANTLKLTFLAMKDMAEFGDVDEAAPLFVPPGATVLSSSSRVGETGKGYYTWNFEFGSARVLLTAAVEQGNCYLLGQTASVERWAGSEGGFERAAASFKVGPDAVPPKEASVTLGTNPKAAVNTPEVTLDDGARAKQKPPGTLDCKGPLPILCSVED
jgi:hypothetical protein